MEVFFLVSYRMFCKPSSGYNNVASVLIKLAYYKETFSHIILLTAPIKIPNLFPRNCTINW